MGDSLTITNQKTKRGSLLPVLEVLVRGLSKQGNGIGAGQKMDQTSIQGNGSFFNDYMEKYRDQALEAEIESIFRHWGEESRLHLLRTKHAITEESELPFSVFGVNRTSAQLAEKFWGRAFCSKRKGTILYFPLDYDFALEHEYLHGQYPGLTFGYRALFYKGFDEAMTENFTSVPKSYPKQREILDRVLSRCAVSIDVAESAYKGDMAARVNLVSALARGFDLSDLLICARMSGVGNPQLYDRLEQSVALDPYEAGDELGFWVWGGCVDKRFIKEIIFT